MSTGNRTTLDTLAAHLEELWGHFDTLYATLEPDGWAGKHGGDWTFADLPYHMAYCDRDAVARPIEMGRAWPASEQTLCANLAELDEWNARKFAERPAGQTVAQSLAQMRAARDAVRRVLTSTLASDADLEQPAWFVVFRGWGPARGNLEWCRAHTWNELIQLRIHLQRETPVPSAAVTRAAIGFDLGLVSGVLNRELASQIQFTAVMEFTDPGVEPWTISVGGGAATSREGRPERADLVMTQSAATFLKTITGIQHPMVSIQQGELQVSDFVALGTFAQLFPLPA
ncbi:MAG: hypothetical protein HY259_10425 [Chloroflexi bacterium]|nr:hypothetical protein [Chloroflexota bacterium]MBI3733853.1 hypothetical protein [Chloroflexota bacterium]